MGCCMIDSVDKKLTAWSVWAELGNCHRLGFKDSALSRIGGVSSTTDTVPEFLFDPHFSAELELIDKLIAGQSPQYECIKASSRKVILAWYRCAGTATQKARDLGCHRDTLYTWLERAQCDLARCLDQAKFGIRMRGVQCTFTNIPDAANN